MLISAIPEDLCLSYANTLTWRGHSAPVEKLRELADILGWIERTGVVTAAATRSIRQWSRTHAENAATVFAEAIAIREALFRIFSAIAVGESIRPKDFALLKTAVAKTPPRSQLNRAGEHYAWQIDELRPSVADVLAPVLWSAGDLLLDAGQRRIRCCANKECLWLFIDQSKNGTRRWCDMSACGNRAKARRHYSRIRGR
jgi:predicted RNA-binding Zn ribbon-like protein